MLMLDTTYIEKITGLSGTTVESVVQELNQWLKDRGSVPDVEFQTVRSWFYKSFPSWVVAVLNQK